MAALRNGRDGIGVEIDPDYCRLAAKSLNTECSDLFRKTNLVFEKTVGGIGSPIQLRENLKLYQAAKQRKVIV